MDVSSGGPWEGLGLDALGARVLEYLVGHPSADAGAVAEVVGTSVCEAERVLRALEDELLVIRIPGGSPRWKAGPPRSSLGSLLARRRSELARTELFVEQLDELYRSAAHPGAPDLVEVLEQGEEVTARYAYLLKGSRSEVLHLSKPPYVTETADDSGHRDPDRTAVAPGVRLRSVYEADGLTDEVSLETVMRGIAVGGELRLGTRVPVKLAVFDRTAALLPLHLDRPSAGSLVVHSSALIEVCVALFEGVWACATPVSLESRQDWPVPRGEREAVATDERTRAILHLMATGMKDDAIARVLGVSRRTVQKHVSDAGAALGARTRFQIALLARDRGWLDG
ncbi:helix-turn-helix transcriptional regulator [Actinacidiphila sp. bgisy167]|uniref:helix-turn-helix transcriptional regulator n=1 Tax=Actinacidiphila sp. bgisy167 TaxID=3413797 RepID=UPI003D71E218